jgi:hypothetical protein
MARGVVLLAVLLLVLVEALAAVPTGSGATTTTSPDYLGGGNKKQQQQQQSPEKRVDDYFAAVAKKLGLRSFTGGRGKYKSMAKEFLDAHNRVRAQYGVPPLRWSNKLARYARRWSEARRFDCVGMHSSGSPYGENIFWGSGWDWRAVSAVADWASEASFYDWRAQACHPGQECGHFKQLVWRTTKYVGCGRAECYNGFSFFTCSYDPPGNYKGEEPLS